MTNPDKPSIVNDLFQSGHFEDASEGDWARLTADKAAVTLGEQATTGALGFPIGWTDGPTNLMDLGLNAKLAIKQPDNDGDVI